MQTVHGRNGTEGKLIRDLIAHQRKDEGKPEIAFSVRKLPLPGYSIVL